MGKRRETPNVLSDLLGDKTPKKQNAKEAEGQSAKEAAKKKQTLYLSEETAVSLDRAWVDIRHQTGRAISRSDIIDAAIRLALAGGDYQRVIDVLDV